MNPEDIKPRDALGLLKEIIRPETAKTRDYLEGRWLGPEGEEASLKYWAGPMLPTDHDEYAEMVNALSKACAADNLIQSCLETYLDAVEGLENWRLAPEGTDAPEEPGEEEKALTAYLDRLNFAGLLYHVGLNLGAHGRTVGRPVIPPRFRDEDGNIIPARDLTEALSRVHWQAPGWPRQSRMVQLDTAGTYLHPETLEPVSVFAYSVTRDNATRSAVEVSWVDDDGKTRFRIIEDGQATQDVSLDLGGRLMLLEVAIPRPIVTRSMLGAMDAYVVASTMLNRNTHYAGYVERWAIGVQPPGNWETNEDGTQTFKPAALSTGPARMNFYQQASTIETVTENGLERNLERPVPAQMGRWEPVDPKAIQAALDHWRKAIRSEARQSFLELADNADASGRSREVAAGDYLRSAEKIKDALSAFVRGLIELTLQLAALQLTNGESLRSYRASVDARVKAFPPSAEERTVNLQEWKDGLTDLETAMTRSGIDDPDLIIPKVQAERAERQAQAIAVMQARGVPDANGQSPVSGD